MKLPTISIVTPTLNSEKILSQCLESIKAQDYPRKNIEVLIVDGGSTDRTLEIARGFSVDRIIPNPLKTAEAAYAIAVRESKNEIIAFIDSDNILPSKDWLRRMVEPFQDEEIVGSEPLYYTYREQDNLITRYCALMGMNDPLCLYLENYDRYCMITKKWTGSSFSLEGKTNYLKIELLDETDLPTIGANGFLVRRKELMKSYLVENYWFDVDAIYALVKSGYNKFAKVKIGIVHIFAGNTRKFVKKQRRRIKDYLYFEEREMRTYSLKELNKLKIAKFVFSTIFIFPLVFDVLKCSRYKKDRTMLFHILACWITLIVYGFTFIESLFRKEIASREKW
jgi:glycosyltransferase involved in cell wall biosynthesis